MNCVLENVCYGAHFPGHNAKPQIRPRHARGPQNSSQKLILPCCKAGTLESMSMPSGTWPPQAPAPNSRPNSEGHLSPSTPAERRPSLVGSAIFIGGWLALMWLLEAADAVSGGMLDTFGVSPRDISELPQIFTAPFLHFGFGHLMANSLPFLVLGVLVRMSGRRTFWVATLTAIVCSGLLTWLISPPSTVTAGASGLVFGWLGFLLLRGLFAHNWMQIIVAAAVFGFFGGILWGVLPTMSGISWQGHLGGVLGGVLAAWWPNRPNHRRSDPK